MKVICNNASDRCPESCYHLVPHPKVKLGELFCTQWSRCSWLSRKTRCTKVNMKGVDR
jgi:hypothetical protein